MPSGAVPVSRLVALTLALAGCNFCWSIQIGYSTATFQQFGMPQSLVSWAWLAGPVSGMLVQPVVGAYSDRCTSRFGRRRPFIAAGWLAIMVGLLLFANADVLGGDPEALHRGHNDHVLAGPLALAIVGFWLVDFAVNAVQGPVRTLLADVAPPEQQQLGNALFGFMTGFGNAAGAFIGAVDLETALPFFGTSLSALYTIGMVFVTVTVWTCLLVVKEEPLHTTSEDSHLLGVAADGPERGSSSSSSDSAAADAWRKESLWHSMRRLTFPDSFKWAFLAQSFSFISFFTVFMFATEWVGSAIYHGESGTDKFNKGVRWGNLALGVQNVFVMVAAPSLPWLCERVRGTKWIHFSGQTLMAVVLGLTPLVAHFAVADPPAAGSLAIVVVLFALLGWTWSCIMTIPWSIISHAVGQTPDAGTYFALFNFSQSAPELLSAGLGSALIAIFGTSTAVLVMGAVASAISAAIVLLRFRDDASQFQRLHETDES